MKADADKARREFADIDAMMAEGGARMASGLAADNMLGVQARMLPVTREFLRCLAHEKQRGRARGVPPMVLFDGCAAVLAQLVVNTVTNLTGGGLPPAVIAGLSQRVFDLAMHVQSGRQAPLVRGEIDLKGGHA